MAIILGHMVADYDNGRDSSALMLSASYTLVPGVAWKSSSFTGEDHLPKLSWWTRCYTTLYHEIAPPSWEPPGPGV